MKTETIREILTGFFLGMLGTYLGMSFVIMLLFAITGGLSINYIIKELKK